MLILTRNLGERIFINDDIVITILSKKGNQIKLGITAPKEYIVHREEIYIMSKISPSPQSSQPEEEEASTTKIKGSMGAVHRVASYNSENELVYDDGTSVI